MSRIYDALKKLEAERTTGAAEGNGHGNGNGSNGHGRRFWRWPFRRKKNGTAAPSAPLFALDLGADMEEAYQRLGTNLLTGPGMEVGRPLKLLGITASRSGEGATTTATVFASILVRRRGGRVAVVEANFRTPSFERVFGPGASDGFAELVRGERTLADVVRPTRLPNLFVIHSGRAPLGPSTVFESPGVGAALDQLRSAFDFVLFDLPAVNLYTDASIVGTRLDGALIVIEADRTRIPEVERARRALERVGVRLIGSVLNRQRSYIPAFFEDML
jgi:capsular exopolysaccharide synthesis family protein